jgi:hypothetical protein
MASTDGFAERQPAGRRSTPNAKAQNGFPPDPPSAGWLAGSLADQPEAQINSQPASQPAKRRARARKSPCSWPDEAVWLCQDTRPAHLADAPQHTAKLVEFLENRGFLRVESAIRRYGVLAVNLVALETAIKERHGIPWAQDLDSPAAYLHSEIRKRRADLQAAGLA